MVFPSTPPAVRSTGRHRDIRACAPIKPALTTDVGEPSIDHRDAAVQCLCVPAASSERSDRGLHGARSRLRELRHWRRSLCREEEAMFDFRDLFQWERFITPSIIKVFYCLEGRLLAFVSVSGRVSR